MRKTTANKTAHQWVSPLTLIIEQAAFRSLRIGTANKTEKREKDCSSFRVFSRLSRFSSSKLLQPPATLTFSQHLSLKLFHCSLLIPNCSLAAALRAAYGYLLTEH
jgi:hypothetical protein